MHVNFVICAVALIFVSCFLTWCLKKYALAKSIIDIPNSRSSHSLPTPRGGGVAIVLSFLLALPLLTGYGLLELQFMWALLGAGLGIALLGFLDDHGHIAAHWRLLGHFCGAIWVMFWMGGLPIINVFGFNIELGWLINIIAVIYLIWLLNLYNFMDGIDGLASVEAIFVCLGGAALFLLMGETKAAVLPLILAASVAGFLIWNFPPAKIFMGDAGSGFLGFILAVLSLKAAWVAPQLLWSWIILLGVFIVDATYTLIHRLVRGEKVYEAHCSHAYQYAARHYKAHRPVTLSVLLINVFWLFPWAFVVASLKMDGATATLVAYIPLIVIAIKFKAGVKEIANS